MQNEVRLNLLVDVRVATSKLTQAIEVRVGEERETFRSNLGIFFLWFRIRECIVR